jgi:rod shape-determining protein MreD
LAPFAVLSLGVFLDLLLGAPSGLWPVSLLAAHGAGYLGRPLLAGQGMLALLAWYLGACAVAFTAAFAFTALAAGEAPSLAAVAWQFLASSALFPAALYLTRRHEEANVGFR